MDEPRANTVSAPQIQFAKYIDGQLTRFNARTTELDYLAISHVWGDLHDVQLRQIPGIPGKVKATPEKAKFLEYELPKLVGSIPFWMDIIAIDQDDEAAVITATQLIPTIFRDALRTIAIRESDGICSDALQGMNAFPDSTEKMAGHNSVHTSQILAGTRQRGEAKAETQDTLQIRQPRLEPPPKSSKQPVLKQPVPERKDLKSWNDIPEEFARTPSPRSKASTPRRGTPSPAKAVPLSADTFFQTDRNIAQSAEGNSPTYEPPEYEPVEPEPEPEKSKCVVM